ncbi:MULTISPECIES: TlyA family RNA methyltransferase [unclassified Mesotoga]|uniref:TlyA family RNA methyltransferase n=1 Tax=unclassified Mesotoga TaxID=1184398 RepID=UPI000DA6D126|nr:MULTISPECIES: TlyA family RNA methyltransferase [unclassified Mesotoga]
MNSKRRLDELLFDLGLSESRTKGAALIKNGKVTVDGMIVVKPSHKVDSDKEIVVMDPIIPVGRGYFKLRKAIDAFEINVEGKRVIDVGASTGGFTQLLLEKGADRVLCVDVGRDQISHRIKDDERVVSLESTDIRGLTLEQAGGKADLLTADLSFISTVTVAGLLRSFLEDGGEAVVLVKPQFEAGPGVVKKGLVNSRNVHVEILEAFVKAFRTNDLFPVGLTFSPIRGKKGNIEYLLYSVVEERSFEFDFERLVEEAFGFFDRDSSYKVEGRENPGSAKG